MADEDDFPDVPLTPQEQEAAAISAEAKNDFVGEEPGVEDVVIEPKNDFVGEEPGVKDVVIEPKKRGRKSKLTLGPVVEAPSLGHTVRALRDALRGE